MTLAGNGTAVIVGAGAAGLMAAGEAAAKGRKVIVIEKNSKPGRKLMITGKGRCNLTNDIDMEGLIANIPGNGNFLYSSFSNFSNYDIMDFFEKRGVSLKVERGGRVFPQSDRAVDIVRALYGYAREKGAEFMFLTEAARIGVGSSEGTAVVKYIEISTGEKIVCESVLIATGGCSYPQTGSTGDGYRMAKLCGHTITEIRPSLVPFNVMEKWIPRLQGLSLKNVAVSLREGRGGKIYDDFGEMLFTDFGVSGPVILSAGAHLNRSEAESGKVVLHIDLKPALTHEKLYERITRDFLENSRKMFRNSLGALLPLKMIPVIIDLSGIGPEKTVNQISKEEKNRLTMLLKDLKLTITGMRPVDEAIITSGGVKVSEINPATMESKKVKGLYFAGEVIDVDGYTGGFNLTIAFSTGYTAGCNI